jgi:hypothetical protein
LKISRTTPGQEYFSDGMTNDRGSLQDSAVLQLVGKVRPQLLGLLHEKILMLVPARDFHRVRGFLAGSSGNHHRSLPPQQFVTSREMRAAYVFFSKESVAPRNNLFAVFRLDPAWLRSELREDKQIRGKGFDRTIYVAKPENGRQQAQAPIGRGAKPVKVSVRRVVTHENQNSRAAIQRRHRQKIENPE